MKQTELKRGTIRVLANYGRSLALVVFSILFVPVFIYGVGLDAFGILGLLGASVGIAEMCKAIVQQSMIRELGAAYHSKDPEAFPNVYNTAVVLCIAAAFIAATLFGGVYLLLPVLNIPDELRTATVWMLIAKAVLSILVVLAAPAANMYKITERMIYYNLWLTLNRATDLIVAVILFLILGIQDPSRGLTLFALFSAGTSAAILLFSVGLMIRMEPRLIPSLSYVNRESMRDLISTSGWNTAAVTALNMHIRLDQFIMNFAFGTVGNGIFTLAVRLTAYVRQIAGSTAEGLEAVSARLSSSDDRGRGIRDMLHHSSRLQAVVTLPFGLIIVLMAEPIMMHWVARTVNNPDVIHKAIVVSQVLILGMTVRGIWSPWVRILYGAGYVRTYAPMILLSGILNPIIAVILIWLLPPAISYLGPAIAFSSIFIFFNLVLMSFIVARCLTIPLRDVYRPFLKPAIVTLVSSPALLLPQWLGWTSLPASLAALAVFGGACMVLTWWFVLDASERSRLRHGARRRFGRRGVAECEHESTQQASHADSNTSQEDEFDELYPKAPLGGRRDVT